MGRRRRGVQSVDFPFFFLLIVLNCRLCCVSSKNLKYSRLSHHPQKILEATCPISTLVNRPAGVFNHRLPLVALMVFMAAALASAGFVIDCNTVRGQNRCNTIVCSCNTAGLYYIYSHLIIVGWHSNT